MADVGGSLAFDDVSLELVPPAGLRAFMPQVDGGPRHPRRRPRLARLRHRAEPGDLGHHPCLSALCRALRGRGDGLPSGRLAVLVADWIDPLVEAVWTNEARLLPELARQGWDLILAPNYSMYGRQPRAEHLLNFRRNLLIAAELQALGAPAVPNIYWFRREDLDRYLEWMADVALAAVAVNL